MDEQSFPIQPNQRLKEQSSGPFPQRRRPTGVQRVTRLHHPNAIKTEPSPNPQEPVKTQNQDSCRLAAWCLQKPQNPTHIRH